MLSILPAFWAVAAVSRDTVDAGAFIPTGLCQAMVYYRLALLPCVACKSIFNKQDNIVKKEKKHMHSVYIKMNGLTLNCYNWVVRSHLDVYLLYHF